MSALLAPDALALHSLITFLARKKFYHQVCTAATQALTKRANDPVLMFWKAFGNLKEGRISDAMRDLEQIRGKQGVQLPVLLCLKIAHESVKLVDREAVQLLEKEIFKEEDAKREGSLFIAAAVCMLTGDNKKGREYIKKVLEIQSNYPQAKSLEGWIELTSGSDIKAKKSLEMFKQAREANRNDMDALLGIAQYYEHFKDLDSAIEELNQCVVDFSWFSPALSEKSRILLAKGDWDQAIDAANRSLTLAPNDIEALRLTVLHMLAKGSRPTDTSRRLAELVEVINDDEPKNARLFYETSALFARFSFRSGPILNICQQLLKKAVELEPSNAEYMTEMGYQHLLQGSTDEANRAYKAATNLDEANMQALYGTIRCQILKVGTGYLFLLRSSPTHAVV
jgi:tetratricopeptide repeat protein 21B